MRRRFTAISRRRLRKSHFVQTNLGIVELQLGRMPEAESALKKAEDINPDDAVPYAYLGIVRDRQGKTDEAMKYLQKSLELDSASHIAHNYLGICFGKKGNRDQAEKEIKEAIALKPDYAAAHFNLAILYATSKPPAMDLAKKYYSKAIELRRSSRRLAREADHQKLIRLSGAGNPRRSRYRRAFSPVRIPPAILPSTQGVAGRRRCAVST